MKSNTQTLSTETLPNDLVKSIRTLFPDRPKIQLHEPEFKGNEWNYVKECLDTGWVSSVGKFVDEFEKQLALFVGVRRAVAIVNGTSALHLALKLAGVEPGDEVLVPDLAFVAVPNAVSYCGAIPHFVDSEEKTLGLNPQKLSEHLRSATILKKEGCFNQKTGRRIRAVVAVHTFGHPVDMDLLLDVAKKYQIEVVEDAAESIGSLYRGRHTGSFGRTAAFSFNGNKTITTGGGGAILTNDESLGALAKHLSTTAKKPHAWEFEHDHIGFNYRMPNINAAVGLAQLEQLPSILERKRKLAVRYEDALKNLKGVRFFKEADFARSNYWLNVVLLNQPDKQLRDTILSALHQNGIFARPAWTLLHKLPMYAKCPLADVTIAESLEARLINIPSSAFL